MDRVAIPNIRGVANHFPKIPRAGEGNRTLTTSLEGWGSTVELHPQQIQTNVNVKINHQNVMGEAGFEPAKAEPPDLQSGPFGRSGIPPTLLQRSQTKPREVRQIEN